MIHNITNKSDIMFTISTRKDWNDYNVYVNFSYSRRGKCFFFSDLHTVNNINGNGIYTEVYIFLHKIY